MSTVWNAFMPIPAKSANALGVLRLVRRRVLPLVIRLLRVGVLDAYSFLIHDRASGVPVPRSDARAYVHVRMTLREVSARTSVRKLLPKAWTIVRRVKSSHEEQQVQRHLDAQSWWYLNFLEHHASLDDEALLQKIGAHLHYFANMAQMRIE